MPVETHQTVRQMGMASPKFIFGSTPGMLELREKIERAIHDDLPVLIEGESGTGKEVVGQYVHTYSARHCGPFLKLDCAAVPADLLAGEMFGYPQVDVRDTKIESVAMTSGGTLFLDEIVIMELSVQQKLQQAITSGHFKATNAGEDRRVNVRFLCATNAGVNAASTNRTFLPELLSCFAHRMHLPPLRDRKEDIPELCEYLLGRFAREFGRPVPRLPSYVLEAFQQWKWPGNIRELENWIARIVIFGAEEVIDLEFSRQLLASEERTLRRHHHVTKIKMGRARRMRRHG